MHIRRATRAFANAWTRNELNNYLIANNRESIDINIITITETTKNLELSPITKINKTYK